MANLKRIDLENINLPVNLQKVLNAMYTEITALRTLANASKTLVNDIRTKLTAFVANGMLSSAGLVIGSTPANVATVEFLYTISGVVYSKAAVAAGTAPGNDVIVQAKYGAVAFDIGADGTIDVIEATNQAAAQFTTAVAAIAALPAAGSGHVRMGYVTAMKSDGAFTFATTSLAAANTTVAYTSSAGVLAALGAAVTAADIVQKCQLGK
jgi:hypothetical protein